MVFAAVAGHLQSLEFTEQYKKWHGCAPVELYTAPVVKFVPEVSASMLQWQPLLLSFIQMKLRAGLFPFMFYC